jgi:FkbM family methyltransferase
MDVLELRLRDQVTLAVPGHLDSITTYVLLEQEMWFEKELGFLSRWVKRGMTAIDIGANLGVYSLPMARLVGPEGRVFAYEPGSQARGLLERSRAINVAGNLQILSSALSDDEREGRLVFGASSELHALGGGAGEGEAVHITSLDRESAAHGWDAPDFVKIDAEGEEERILAGGRNFFERNSPLVMFEIKAGGGLNENLRAALPAMGYGLFRALVGAPFLVAIDPRVPLDSYELNLFAAKPDRVRALRDEGLLIEAVPRWKPDRQTVRSVVGNAAGIDPDYAEAMTAFAVWRSDNQPAQLRFAALVFACRTLSDLCNRAPSPARLSTYGRLAWEGGWRSECVSVLSDLASHLERDGVQTREPFWPASPRYDDIAPGDDDPALWFKAAVVEQLERAQKFSSFFGGPSRLLTWLCEQPFASAEMHRRRTLAAARAGANPGIEPCLKIDAPDNLNAGIWRSGDVPGTRIDQ